MARLTIHFEEINATPKNYPVPQLLKIFPRLKKYLQNDAGPMLQRDMEDTVKNWKHKPNMVSTITQPYGTRLQLTVEPKGPGTLNWQRVSMGTGPRRIVSHKRMMRFRPGYVPKTTPGGKYGGPGTRSGPWLRAWSVGNQKPHRIKPREFSKKIIKRRENKIHRDVRGIMRRVRWL